MPHVLLIFILLFSTKELWHIFQQATVMGSGVSFNTYRKDSLEVLVPFGLAASVVAPLPYVVVGLAVAASSSVVARSFGLAFAFAWVAPSSEG
mmetsp:Transcript_19240/g.30990  ORF Transcript_19240/g.30990 Transcript_19240/m.30990 type:complete len:93 (+) Transcript_19240:292-570(+)